VCVTSVFRNSSNAVNSLSIAVNFSQKYDVCAFFDNLTLMQYLYVDGVLVDSGVGVSGNITPPTKLIIAGASTVLPTASNRLNGSIGGISLGYSFPSGFTNASFFQCLHYENCSMYQTEGTQSLQEQVITPGYNRVSMTLDNWKIPSGTMILARMGYNNSGVWTYTGYQNITGNVNSTRCNLNFTISASSTGLKPEFKMQSDGTETPILRDRFGLILETYNVTKRYEFRLFGGNSYNQLCWKIFNMDLCFTETMWERLYNMSSVSGYTGTCVNATYSKGIMTGCND
jgi:hypothetical protein